MIIFSLETLADSEHRRHFVDPKNIPCYCFGITNPHMCLDICERRNFKPNYQAFYEACENDTPIQPVIDLWNDKISLGMMGSHQIWTGRCESVRSQTEKWLDKNLLCFEPHQLKMRPIGDNIPEHELKEKWLDEYVASMWPKLDKDAPDGTIYHRKDPIEFVFDSDPKSIEMWRRRGIFVFDCNQTGKEF